MSRFLKYHKFISFGISLAFLIVLQRFGTPEPIFRFLVPAFLLLVLAVGFYNRWYLKQHEKYNFWLIIRPLLVMAAGFGLFLIIPGEGLRGMFLITAILIITLSELLLGVSTENILLVETLLVAFGLFLTFAAFFEYAPLYSTYYVGGVFVAAALLARCFYEPVPKPAKTKLVSSLVIGLFCAQVFWALNFLPFHFSPSGFISFAVFYFCLIANYYYFYQNISFKKIQFHLLLIFAAIVLVIIFTPWSIIH